MSNFELLDEYHDASNNTFTLERSQLVGTPPDRPQTADKVLPGLEFFDPQKQANDYQKELDRKLREEMLGDGNEKTKLKDNYDNKTLDEGVKAAIENKVPMVVHIGAPWCLPCKKMEENVWPGVEKDLKGKAAFAHLNGDEIMNEGKGGDAHKALTKGVESFPTIKVVEPYYKDGKIQFKTIAEHSGGMTDDQVRDMLRKAKVGASSDAAK